VEGDHGSGAWSSSAAGAELIADAIHADCDEADLDHEGRDVEGVDQADQDQARCGDVGGDEQHAVAADPAGLDATEADNIEQKPGDPDCVGDLWICFYDV